MRGFKRHYKLSEAINTSDVDARNCRPFFTANEVKRKDGSVGRAYVVFESFESFLANRKQFPHCHEILVDHKLVKAIKHGRLVFDFDIGNDYELPDNFTDMVEYVIRQTARKHLKGINRKLFKFVWSECPNPSKTSMHLTVKGCCFKDWIQMTQRFYACFCVIWDNVYTWIKSDDLVDKQIARKNTSLRMVGSKKIGGNPLRFLDPDSFTLADSLIRIYDDDTLKSEQKINKSNWTNLPSVLNFRDDDQKIKCAVLSFLPKERTIRPTQNIKNKVHRRAFNLLQQVRPGMFSIRDINGQLISLKRESDGECICSGNIHESENSCLVVFLDESVQQYVVLFKCFRNCGKKEFVRIGRINANTGTIYKDI